MMVADASVWINLAATGGADRILGAITRPLVITDVALGELERGRPKGRRAADEVTALIHMGLMQVVALAPEDEALFLSLVSGPASETLDDGETATLACAARLGAWAVIDERKATSLAARRLPHLEVRSTCDLLLGAEVRGVLGEPGLVDAVFAALTDARMRVPDGSAEAIVGLLGDRAASCHSIPARFRTARSGR
jgi:predicted nucleic acid-binding protein